MSRPGETSLPFASVCATGGDGLWSRRRTDVRLERLEVPYVDDDGTFGELRVHFDVGSWDVDEDGLIYTDRLFLRGLREGLRQHGFSAASVADVDYSEQGMQGDDYVSMDVGGKFLAEWRRLTDGSVADLGQPTWGDCDDD